MCIHLECIRHSKESSSYILLHSFFVTCTHPGSSKKKTLASSCYVCQKSGVGARLHACLSCVFMGCLKDHFEGHERNQEKHKFAMDLFFGEIYCLECKDYVYDEYFSAVTKKLPSGQIKETFTWLPPKKDRKFFENHKVVKINQSLAGLRGLVNMGETCYINCIIQVLAHTPMMRNYFLSGRHSCPPERREDCHACLLSEIFQELYSGGREPLPLQKLLVDLWLRRTIFKGKNANDALEFYNCFLDDLHDSCTGVQERKKEKFELPIQNYEEDSNDLDMNGLTITDDQHSPINHHDLEEIDEKLESPIQNHEEDSSDLDMNGLTISQTDNQHPRINHHNSKPCRCVIHQIFSGQYQTVLSCSKCGILESNAESWSIILPYGGSDDQPVRNNKKQNKVHLTDCIKKCIQGTEQGCRRCISKKLEKPGIEKEHSLFKVLPNILCFHLVKKTQTGETNRNLQTEIEFQEYLDMSLHTHETVKSLIWRENGTPSFKKNQSSKNMYILYAIVCHGHDPVSRSGHYYTYVRKGKDIWYKCSDTQIERVKFQDISKSEGVLFFYIKEVLEYEKISLHLNESEHNTCGGRRNYIENGY